MLSVRLSQQAQPLAQSTTCGAGFWMRLFFCCFLESACRTLWCSVISTGRVVWFLQQYAIIRTLNLVRLAECWLTNSTETNWRSSLCFRFLAISLVWEAIEVSWLAVLALFVGSVWMTCSPQFPQPLRYLPLLANQWSDLARQFIVHATKVLRFPQKI